MTLALDIASHKDHLVWEHRYHTFRDHNGINCVVKVTYVLDKDHRGFAVIEDTLHNLGATVHSSFTRIASDIMLGLLELGATTQEAIHKFEWYEVAAENVRLVTMHWNARVFRYSEPNWFIPNKDVQAAVLMFCW